jgi:glutaredoxin
MSGAARIELYLSPACPHCCAARTFLRDRQVTFDEYDVTADRDALARLIWLTGRALVPAIVAGHDVLVGFDATRLQTLIDEASRPRPEPSNGNDEGDAS